MADDNERKEFSDFDMSEIFSDFKATRSGNEKSESVRKQKFVVHIDDSVDDSFDYDFAAFSSASDRANEEKRREESRRSFEQFEVKPEELKRVSGPEKVDRSPFTIAGDKSGSVPGQRRRAEYVPPEKPTPNRSGVAQQRNGGMNNVSSGRMPTENRGTSPNPPQIQRNENRQDVSPRPKVTPQPKQRGPVGNMNDQPTVVNKARELPDDEKPVVRIRKSSKNGAVKGLVGFLVMSIIFSTVFTYLGLSTINDVFGYDLGYKLESLSKSEEEKKVDREKGKEVKIENEPNGDPPTLEHVIDALKSAGLIENKSICLMFAKFRHFDGYNTADGVWVPTEYLSGVYYLEPGLGIEGMLNTIKKSNNTGADTIKLMFPEGWTISQIFEKLEKNGVCEQSKLYANIESVAKQYDFYYSINKSGVRYLGVEGYLFPDTYEFYKNENPVSVLKKLFDNADAKWLNTYEKRAKELGYTRDEILIIASIIQREAANKSQMGDVSSVIHNRLKSSTYPRLQCNSTLDYVTNSVKGHVNSNLAELYSTEYNTYRIEGLPPGPICNPGIDAIEAALNPNDTNYYFFVHNNKGKIYLSENYAQFQRDWEQVLRDNAS